MKDLKEKRTLVTGGAGFIGSNMVEALMDEGAYVTVYDNLSSGVSGFLKKFESSKKFKFVKGDLLDLEMVKKTVKDNKIEMVVHLAANPDVRYGSKKTDLDLQQGTIATYNVLEASRLAGVKDIMFSSSSVVYGLATVLPTPEDYGPLLPISLYGSSKLASEGLITAFSHLFGIGYHIFRFANVVGRNGTHGVVLDFLNHLAKTPNELPVLGDGKQRKSYIDVVDCVNAMLYVYKNSPSNENVFNIATDDQLSVETIAKLVIRKFAPNAKIKYSGGKQGWPGDVPNAFLSNKKLKELGFKPRFNTSLGAMEDLINEIWKSRQKSG